MNELKLKVFRIVTCAWLIGWFLKIGFYGPYLTNIVFEHPLSSDLFPPPFTEPAVSLLFYFLPVVALSSLFLNKRTLLLSNACIMTAASWVLLVHINTYNDATFVSSFWVGLWLIWFSYSQKEGEPFLRDALVLAQCVIAVIFLGGFVGKLTDKYISGEAFYQIFMLQGHGSLISDLSKLLPVVTQKMMAAVIAKCVLFFEFLLAVNVIFPAAYAFWTALVVLPLLALFSSWRIFSVTAGLIGLAWAGLVILKERIR